jgi:hypothetical protein
MKPKKLSLKLLPDRMAVCRFDPTTSIPNWVGPSDFYSVTGTDQELTIVCAEAFVAQGTASDTGGQCSTVEGPLDFSEIGIIFSLTQPLAQNNVPVFVISTFDPDYFMVKEKDLAKTIDVLTAAGHQINTED